MRELSSSEDKKYNGFVQCRSLLEEHFGGFIEAEGGIGGGWIFMDRNNDKIIPINLSAEGIRKIGILEILLGNGYLSNNSIIFIDEPSQFTSSRYFKVT